MGSAKKENIKDGKTVGTRKKWFQPFFAYTSDYSIRLETIYNFSSRFTSLYRTMAIMHRITIDIITQSILKSCAGIGIGGNQLVFLCIFVVY